MARITLVGKIVSHFDMFKKTIAIADCVNMDYYRPSLTITEDMKKEILSSDWKTKVPEGHTPIDVFLSDDKLCECLIRGIYDYETYIGI